MAGPDPAAVRGTIYAAPGIATPVLEPSVVPGRVGPTDETG